MLLNIQKRQTEICLLQSNYIQGNLNPEPRITNTFLASGMYKLTCADCGKGYIEKRCVRLYLIILFNYKMKKQRDTLPYKHC
jgi:hypothetical protein